MHLGADSLPTGIELINTKTTNKFDGRPKDAHSLHKNDTSCSTERTKRGLPGIFQTLEFTFWSYHSEFLVHHIFKFAIIWRRAGLLLRWVKEGGFY